jgi:electron transport complex protein RnfB
MGELPAASSYLSTSAVLLGLTLICSALIGYAWARFPADRDRRIVDIDDLLPQTQCGQCGHPGCRPYAEAIADGQPINRCPPGGQATIDALAQLLGVKRLALDPKHGTENSEISIAYIREDECIGCTKCIQACPVDAIVGAPKLMHTVIVDQCTGCDLCVEPCPVDCIDMLPVPINGGQGLASSALLSTSNIIPHRHPGQALRELP